MLRSIAQGHDLCVGGRIVSGNGAVAATPDDLAVANDDCTDGHLARCCCLRCESKGLAHERLVPPIRAGQVFLWRLR